MTIKLGFKLQMSPWSRSYSAFLGQTLNFGETDESLELLQCLLKTTTGDQVGLE